ncbi:MAG: hypothetical protein H0W61_06015 [Bacteroidetes bacterium]|nr:hypothetical protein [Bacteroidota bacterium]
MFTKYNIRRGNILAPVSEDILISSELSFFVVTEVTNQSLSGIVADFEPFKFSLKGKQLQDYLMRGKIGVLLTKKWISIFGMEHFAYAFEEEVAKMQYVHEFQNFFNQKTDLDLSL